MRVIEKGIPEEEDIATGDSREDDHDAERVVSERLQHWYLFHVGDDVPCEDFRWAIVIEFLKGESIHLFTRHIPDIREIDGIDRDEAEYEDGDIFLRIGEGEFQGFSFRNAYGRSEPVADRHDPEYREDENGGKFHGLCEPENDTGDDQVSRRGIPEESDEEICGDEDGGRDAEVGRDIVGVCDDIWIEGIEEHGEYSGDRTRRFLRETIEEISREEAEEDDREAREEDEEIGVIQGTIEEECTDIPLLIDAFGPERVMDREGGLKDEEGEADEVLEERWVFIVDTHVAVPNIAEGGRNMGPFIVGGGIGPGGPERQSEEDGKHKRDDDGGSTLHELEEWVHRVRVMSKIYILNFKRKN